ncbi:glycosyltransferase [Spirosoma aureum]|uniref:Glycosyltransferase n=1 Tax=Spirosoma aureum TaxID=2692134 RepID=A0A6G9AN44_9BACT|nr:glycosyltransferase [Spirosoma aureum]QIP13891.1 glycosyltransferase [Spirosoma aureum]
MTEAAPSVSVCIITYNHEQFIGQAIDSVLMQECTFPIDIVIGEDCSADSTGGICREYALKHAHIKLLNNQTNLGMVNNFLRTSMSCSGKYIAMLEGDDYWTDPHKLQKQVDFLEANSDFILCYHDKTHQKDGAIVRESTYDFKENKYFVQEEVFAAHILTVTVVFRNILSEHPFPAAFRKLPLYDFGAWAYLSLFGKCAYLNFNGATYRIHADSVFSSKEPLANYSKMLRLFRLLKTHFPQNYQPNFKYYALLIYFMITEELRLKPFSAKYLYYLSVLFIKSRQFNIDEFTGFYSSLYKTIIKKKIKSVLGRYLEVV